MFMSWDAEKEYDKIQYSFIKTLNKIGTEEMYLYIIKVIYNKCTSNIILNGKRLKFFYLRLGKRQRCPFSLLLFNIVLDVLARAIRKGKIKDIRIGKWKVKQSLFVDDMIICENPEYSAKELLGLINEFSTHAGHKMKMQKSIAFLYTYNKLYEKEIKSSHLIA